MKINKIGLASLVVGLAGLVIGNLKDKQEQQRVNDIIEEKVQKALEAAKPRE